MTAEREIFNRGIIWRSRECPSGAYWIVLMAQGNSLGNRVSKQDGLLIIRKMQVKTTMRYYLTPVRMAIIKKTGNKKR